MLNDMGRDGTTARELLFDNAKALLICLVVLGHVAQKYVHSSGWVYLAFVLIYCVHMPLFVFISGYLARDAERTRAMAFERYLVPYVFYEGVWFAVSRAVGWETSYDPAVPWFALWFFLSLFTLGYLLPLLARIRWIVPILFGLALVSGFGGGLRHDPGARSDHVFFRLLPPRPLLRPPGHRLAPA
ncbi:MAG: acyltransferase family protein [Propionibacteriaceae bacterium]|nr:acyltransferase family protein [Propionibacteriaceae bacterium]